jgi:ribosomal protein L20A (L18A)
MISWSKVLEKLNMGNYNNYYDVLKDMLQFLYYEQKLSIRQIAELTDGECSNVSIREKMKEFGIIMRSKGGPNHAKPFTISKKEYKELSYKEMALKYGVHRTTIRNRCISYIKESGKKRKEKKK